MICFMTSMAQTNNEHLTFKGIPIDGPLKQFATKLKNAGFKPIGSKDSGIFQGEFSGFKDCTVFVFTSYNSDNVWSVGVLFPESDDWNNLEGTYLDLKDALTKKYGNPFKCIEEFQGYSAPRDNLDKLIRVKNEPMHL